MITRERPHVNVYVFHAGTTGRALFDINLYIRWNNEDFWHVSRKFVINIFTREEEISWRFLHKGRTIKYYSPLSNNHLLTTLISATPKIRILSRLSFLRLSFARSLETGILRGNPPWVRWQLVLASFYDPRGASSNPKIGPWSRILHGRTVWTPPATFAFDGLSSEKGRKRIILRRFDLIVYRSFWLRSSSKTDISWKTGLILQ